MRTWQWPLPLFHWFFQLPLDIFLSNWFLYCLLWSLLQWLTPLFQSLFSGCSSVIAAPSGGGVTLFLAETFFSVMAFSTIFTFSENGTFTALVSFLSFLLVGSALNETVGYTLSCDSTISGLNGKSPVFRKAAIMFWKSCYFCMQTQLALAGHFWLQHDMGFHEQICDTQMKRPFMKGLKADTSRGFSIYGLYEQVERTEAHHCL